MLNKVTLIGRLGQDPEVRYTGSGSAVANFTVATNEVWFDKDKEKQERTEWHRIVVWGNQAESCGKYLAKGRQVYVEGRIQTRKWENKEGVEQYTTEIVAQSVKFLGTSGAPDAGNAPGGGGWSKPATPPAGDAGTINPDDIPF